ncbi:MAG: phenylalanine--tRNA ligase subunit beta [Bacteroidota bacterium]
MLISYKWLKEFVDFDYSPEELDKILTMLGIEVESISDYANKYKNFYTAKVIKKDKHPDADKLSVCIVTDTNIERTVVCGAPNVEEGQIVILGIPGAVVPNGNFTIESRTIRKVKSDGMICSKAELELSEDHSGIWVLPADVPAGMPLAEYLNMNDVVFETGITPNRADCLSHIGIAREIAAYNNSPLRKHQVVIKESQTAIESAVQVIIEDDGKCPRYTARLLKDVKPSESPDWLKNKLILLGMRPINVIVDVTNFVLLETGQPLHAFDFDLLEDSKIIVKTAAEGEKFKTLDGKEHTLDSEMLMICDGKKSVAIGGVMGGSNSEINPNTKNILIESAFFSPKSIRRTSKKLGIQSEASYRFERGVDIENVIYALDRAAILIAELTGATIEKGRIDVYLKPRENYKCKVRYKRACDIVGITLEKEKIISILKSLSFKILQESDLFVMVEVPPHRIDINYEIDLIEEIARMYNYDNIEPDLTSSINFGSTGTPEKLAIPPLRKQLEDYLVHNGYYQILTQNMLDPVSARLFSEDNIEIANPLGEDLSIMRPTLIVPVLRTIERNLRMGSDNLKLFEIAKTFHHTKSTIDTFIEGIEEREELIIAHCGKPAPVQWSDQKRMTDFFDIKGVFEAIAKFFKLTHLTLVADDGKSTAFSKNCLRVVFAGETIGYIGEIKKDLLKKFEIDTPVQILNIKLSALYVDKKTSPKYKPISPYPGMKRDLAFVVDSSVTADTIEYIISEHGTELLQSTVLFDVYSGKSIGERKKSLAYSLYFSAIDRTLKEEEIDNILASLIKTIELKTGAKLRTF